MVLGKRGDTFVPNKKRANTIRYQDLHKYAQASLGAGANRDDIEKIPSGTDRKEWLAIHADTFTNECMILMEEVVNAKGFCTCTTMTAGPNYKYLWADPSGKCKPVEMAAGEYCANTIDWILDLLDDETFFPQEENAPFPKDFDKKIKKVFQRMIRIYAHWYRSHLADFETHGAVAHLNTCFRHFYFFCVGNKVVADDSKDWEPVKTEIEVIVKAG